MVVPAKCLSRRRRSLLRAGVAALPSSLSRGLLAGAAIGLAGVGGCGRQSGFRAIDITGADFAKGFDLTDHRGRRTRLEDFSGKLLVVFFGYTQCPDVCPTTMAEMAEVMRRLGPLAEQVRVAFITVDPERDTQELLSHYVPAFHPEFIGSRVRLMVRHGAQAEAIEADLRRLLGER
jgi:protein SCO1/2